MPGVTKEQIQAAREADLFAYLQFHEPGVLKRDGPNYRHKEHDSLVYVTGKRYWYWNSRGRSINALDYLIQIFPPLGQTVRYLCRFLFTATRDQF